MKDEYDLDKMRERKPIKVDPEAGKTAINIRLNSCMLGDIKVEARRLGIPYQTLINSVLHRFVTGELIDKKEQKS